MWARTSEILKYLRALMPNPAFSSCIAWSCRPGRRDPLGRRFYRSRRVWIGWESKCCSQKIWSRMHKLMSCFIKSQKTSSKFRIPSPFHFSSIHSPATSTPIMTSHRKIHIMTTPATLQQLQRASPLTSYKICTNPSLKSETLQLNNKPNVELRDGASSWCNVQNGTKVAGNGTPVATARSRENRSPGQSEGTRATQTN